MRDLSGRLSNQPVQLTSDGHKAYIDHAMLAKHCGPAPGQSYGVRRHDPPHRDGPAFTCLTNAFSKKVENHFYALAIYFMHYNYVGIHQTLRVTPPRRRLTGRSATANLRPAMNGPQ